MSLYYNERTNEMKIAIVTVGFEGSSSSLAEAHLLNGHQVDFYHVIFTSQHTLEYESFTLLQKSSKIGIKKLEHFESDGLRRFSAYCDRFNFYNVVCFGMPQEGGVLNALKKRISLLIMANIFSILRKRDYDIVNIAGQNQFAVSLSCLLNSWQLPIIHSFHEVLASHLGNPTLYPGIGKLIKDGIRINVFSDKSAYDLKNVINISNHQLSSIPFGLFTGYKEYAEVNIPEIKEIDDYILFYGYIEKYKGLDVLYEAINNIENLTTKVVIAGRGSQPVIEKIKRDERFVLLNRWLENAELVTLIKHCKFVVCPYLSASQSGIPQTVFNFDKPILATDIESFKAVIHDGFNGMIVKRNDAFKLADAIKKILFDKGYYSKMIGYIKDYRECESMLEWKAYASKYINFMKS